LKEYSVSYYSEFVLDLIFQKATRTLGWPEWAIDCDGRFIRRSEYGQYSEFGWQVDHTVPSAIGGNDLFANLRPRHWRGNSMAGGSLGGLLG
jgi:hypothetical protein